MDLEFLINENYFTFLMLGGLLIVMYAYRNVHLPATGNFLLIIAVLFLMSISNSVELWAVLSPDREGIRMFMSVAHYVLQPFVIYLELVIIMREEEHDRRKDFLIALPLMINTVVYLMAPFTDGLVFGFDEDYVFDRGMLGYTIYIVTFFYLIFLLIWSVKIFRNDRRNSVILLFMTGAAILTGAMEGTNIAPGYIDETFALGVFLYYMYLVTVHESEMQASLSAEKLELSQSKVRLMREQMQPHFIFNSLQIIKSLIRTDQNKAVLCLEDFSDYLKANMDALRSDKLITFEEELEHIKAYVSLAVADETKKIEVKYDIEESAFMVPPFTVEPIVENALRHGVRDEGMIEIASKADGDDHVITIFDNGRGFKVPERSDGALRSEDGVTGGESVKEREASRRGIGIENARTRLETQCGGSLDIRSGQEGTTVIIRIPANRADDINTDDK